MKMMTNGMLNLENRIIDDKGNVVYFTDALIELLYNGEIPSEILYPQNDPDVDAFNKYSYENLDDIFYTLPKTIKSLDERRNDWFYTEKYDNIDLNQYFNNLCNTQEELDRVNYEIKLYKEKGYEKFLRFCIFLPDKIAEKDWVIGVGRGSSCASYCLRLINIHMVDSIKYDLDIKEFLK